MSPESPVDRSASGRRLAPAPTDSDAANDPRANEPSAASTPPVTAPHFMMRPHPRLDAASSCLVQVAPCGQRRQRESQAARRFVGRCGNFAVKSAPYEDQVEIRMIYLMLGRVACARAQRRGSFGRSRANALPKAALAIFAETLRIWAMTRRKRNAASRNDHMLRPGGTIIVRLGDREPAAGTAAQPRDPAQPGRGR